MTRLKNILTALALAAAGFLFFDAVLDAAVWENYEIGRAHV